MYWHSTYAVPTKFLWGEGKEIKQNKLPVLDSGVKLLYVLILSIYVQQEVQCIATVDCTLFYQKVGVKTKRNLSLPSHTQLSISSWVSGKTGIWDGS